MQCEGTEGTGRQSERVEKSARKAAQAMLSKGEVLQAAAMPPGMTWPLEGAYG